MQTDTPNSATDGPTEVPVTENAGTSRPVLSWTDFQTVLAVARAGSIAKAYGTLGMTHSTLLRKLDLIETRLRTKVFERGRDRYGLTAAGHEIVDAALAFDPIATAAEMRARGQDLRPSGTVRVSAASVMIEHLLPHVLAQFRSAFPEIKIELTASREHANLRRRDADVAIRIADQVPDWLVGRKLADLRFKIYGLRRDQSDATPRNVEDLLAQKRWISFERDERDLKFDRWLANTLPDSNVVLRVDSFSHAATMVRAGLGIALLPAFVESRMADLQPLTESIPALQTPLWIITHPDLKETTRIKVLMRAFGPALAHAAKRAQADHSIDS